MLSLVLLCVNLALFLYIIFYGICFFALPFIHARERDKRNTVNSSSPPAVTVLVPCHNEGPALVQAIESLLTQNYAGEIKIVALVRDKLDSAFPHLVSRFAIDPENIPADQKIVLFHSGTREVVLELCGAGPKRDKLNLALPSVTTPYVGFLDADHRADPEWITVSIEHLLAGRYAGVQSRRRPLSLKTLPQLWDSAQNHIGNELVNATLDRTVDNVFFTGTTCLFETAKLQGHQFGDCVTEDTFLSYELLAKGERITYNPDCGSREEVAPDLSSYIARRRRWSCGHNKTFFSLAGSVLRAPIGWRLKAATLIHGLFYTVPVAVCLLLNVYALHLFVQYTLRLQQMILLISVTLSLGITLWMFGRHRNVIREVLVLALWVFPQVTLFLPIPLYYANSDLVFFLVLFPYVRHLFWAHLFCLLAPALLIISGGIRTKLLPAHQLLLVILCYPFIFFFDLWACLLGFSDFLFGRPTWAKIRRTHQADALDESNRARSGTIILRWAAAIACGAFLLLSFNDLTADSNCGEPDSLLVNPTIFVPSNSVQWSIRRQASIKGSNQAAFTFSHTVESTDNESVEIAHFIDDKVAATTVGSTSADHTFEYTAPLGWKAHRYHAILRSSAVICRRNEQFTTAVKELRGPKLFVNNEEFLVKGVIPSFSPDHMKLSIEQGLGQIKQLGANVVRYYHELRDSTRAAADVQNLLVIDQPDFSTWTDVNLMYGFSRSGLEKRFDRLVNESRLHPYTLFHTAGNELEILDPSERVPKLVYLLTGLTERYPDEWFAYSTFFVYLKLPAAIYGVNMLDTGATYWENGLRVIKSLRKPFYASELGGFVASYESTPEELRAYRLNTYWQQLLNAGAMGGVIHQSHDNWSQPVIYGFNDPLSPDQPDDLRGLWDTNNQEKPLMIRTVENMFSDLEAAVAAETITLDATDIPLRLTNRRPYWLHNILFDGVSGSFDLAPGSTYVMSIPNPHTPALRLIARFETHHGLHGKATLNVRLPLNSTEPVVLNSDLLDLTVADKTAQGRLLSGTTLDTVIPDGWSEVSINGERASVTPGRHSFPIRSSMEEVVQLESSTDAVTWTPIDPHQIGRGPIRLRFKLQRSYPAGAKLLMGGLASTKFWIRYGAQGKWQESSSHHYRENIVELDSLSAAADDYCYLLVTRTDTNFLAGSLNPEGGDVDIRLEMPRVFSPVPFSIERVQ